MRRRKKIYDGRGAATAVLANTARRAVRAGTLWGYLFGVTIAATAWSYPSSFPTTQSRARLADSLDGNAGFAALFGPIRHIDTVAGYTAYKTMSFLVILGAVWGLLTATRLLRGEEDAGRWELFLCGQTARGQAAAHAAMGLAVGLVPLWLLTAGLTAAVGATSKVQIGVGAALFYATSLVAATAMFMAVGLLVGQLAASRHDANLIGAGVLTGSYLVRMAADSDPSLGWLRWASPLGWIEELRPLTGSQPLAFVPIVAFVAALAVVAVRWAANRDLGASVLAGADRRAPQTLLLGGQAGLTLRLSRPAILAWVTALAATGLVFGLVAQAAGTALRGSPGLERAIARLGGSSAGAVAYFGFVFVFAAGLVAVAVAGQVAAIRNEEAAGRLDNLLVRPVARWRWLFARLAVAAGLVVGASALVGVAAWAGAASQHTGVAFGDLLVAGLNVAPPALFVLGVGVLLFGAWPRAAIGLTYGLVVWSFLIEITSAVFDSSHWLRDTSPLLHIAPAPAADPNWVAAAWLAGLGAAAALAGMVAFGRRDLRGA